MFCSEMVELLVLAVLVVLAEVRLEVAESFRGGGSSVSRGARGCRADGSALALCVMLWALLVVLEALC